MEHVKNSNIHITPSPFKRGRERKWMGQRQYLSLSVKNFPIDERYQVIDSRGAPNSRQSNWKENHTYTHHSKTAENQRKTENHKRNAKWGLFSQEQS